MRCHKQPDKIPTKSVAGGKRRRNCCRTGSLRVFPQHGSALSRSAMVYCPNNTYNDSALGSFAIVISNGCITRTGQKTKSLGDSCPQNWGLALGGRDSLLLSHHDASRSNESALMVGTAADVSLKSECGS